MADHLVRAACGSSAATAGPTTSVRRPRPRAGRGRNVNVLVLDTEVYSNTGGQASKSTPRAPSPSSPPPARRAARRTSALHGHRLRQRLRRAGGHGRGPAQTVRRLPRGGGLRRAVADHRLQPLHRPRHRDARRPTSSTAPWPAATGRLSVPPLGGGRGNPFLLDSPRPRIPLASYTQRELRYRTPGANHRPRPSAWPASGPGRRWTSGGTPTRRWRACGPAHSIPGRRAEAREAAGPRDDGDPADARQEG